MSLEFDIFSDPWTMTSIGLPVITLESSFKRFSTGKPSQGIGNICLCRAVDVQLSFYRLSRMEPPLVDALGSFHLCQGLALTKTASFPEGIFTLKILVRCIC